MQNLRFLWNDTLLNALLYFSHHDSCAQTATMNIVIVITHIVHINIYCNFSKYYSLMMIIQYAVPCFANKIKVHVFRVFELNWSLQQQKILPLSLSLSSRQTFFLKLIVVLHFQNCTFKFSVSTIESSV